MNGVIYFRRKNKLLIHALAKKTGIMPSTLMQIEKDAREGKYSNVTPAPYIKLSDFYGISVADLIRDGYPELPEPERLRSLDADSECCENPISVYRHEKHLSYRRLAPLFGVSYEEIRKVCMLPSLPEKYENAYRRLVG